MLDLRFVAQNFDQVLARLKTRGGDLELGEFQRRMEERRSLYIALEAINQKRNTANEAMKKLAKADPGAVEAVRAEMRAISQEIKKQETDLRQVEEMLEQMLLLVPNLPDVTVPVGASADDNPVIRTWGEKPALAFPPRPHFELGNELGLLDLERAAKVSGARFAFLKGDLARLERALVSLMIDLHTKKGYLELLTPYLVNRASMLASGQLPKFEQDSFRTAGDPEYFLIPTSEVSLVNYHRDEILDGTQLPLRYCAFSPCFRSEAGAAGKDTRGLIRVHQFHKVELVKFTTPETSFDELESMVDHASDVLRQLGLHHRVVLLCTGDMGANSVKTYDLEVWLPGQNAYREISSCSNCGDFQARRAKIRFRRSAGAKPELVHTLNGSGLAVGRTLVAILENYQQADGSVRIPEALLPYMNGVRVLAKQP